MSIYTIPVEIVVIHGNLRDPEIMLQSLNILFKFPRALTNTKSISIVEPL